MAIYLASYLVLIAHELQLQLFVTNTDLFGGNGSWHTVTVLYNEQESSDGIDCCEQKVNLNYPRNICLPVRPGRDADHSAPSSAEVKNRLELYLYSP